MKTLMILIAFFFSLVGVSNAATTEEVAEKIKKLVPRLSNEKVENYSKLIVLNAQKHNLDPMVLTAIIKQESTFRNTTTYVNKKDLSYFDRIVKDTTVKVAKNFENLNTM